MRHDLAASDTPHPCRETRCLRLAANLPFRVGGKRPGMADFGDADARGRERPAMAALDLVDHELLTIAGVGVFRLEPGGIAEWTTPLPPTPKLDPKAMLCPKHFVAACHPDDV